MPPFTQALVIANVVDLSAIASVGSACSLMIFLLVGLSAFKLRAETRSKAWIIVTGITATVIVLAFFAVDTLKNAPETFAAIIAIGLLAVSLDFLWKRARGPGESSAPPAVTSSA